MDQVRRMGSRQRGDDIVHGLLPGFMDAAAELAEVAARLVFHDDQRPAVGLQHVEDRNGAIGAERTHARELDGEARERGRRRTGREKS